MLDLRQVVAKLRPDRQSLKKLLESKDAEPKHLCVHWSTHRLQDTSKCKTKIGCIDQIMVDERPKKLASGCQLLRRVLGEEPALFKQVPNHPAIDLVLPAATLIGCEIFHNFYELWHCHLTSVDLAEVSVR